VEGFNAHGFQDESEREDMRMRRAWVSGLAMVMTICCVATVRAQDVSQADKDRALAYLESTKKGVMDATKGLSDAQWNFKTAPDRWSIAEVMEHLAAAEDMIRGMDQEQVMKAPAAPARDAAELQKIDAMVMAQVPDRSHKIQAPEPLKPTNRFGSPADAQKHFLESRAVTEEYLKTAPDLRAHATDSPMGVKLDGYEWVLLIAAHSERHTKQMLEVKTDPNYPKL
jgi:DinB family protein